MNKISRRQFLRLMALTAGVSTLDPLLSSCGVKPTPSGTDKLAVPTETSELNPPAVIETPSPSSVSTEELPSPAPPQSEGSYPDLVVARGQDPEQMVRRALVAYGGMERFVPPGSTVVIKPNICVAYHSYVYAATTNPWVVGALVRLCQEAGAKSVRVMDYPFGGSAEQAYAVSGIQEQVNAAGGEMVVMPRFGYRNTDIPKGVDLKQCEIHDEVLDADVLINVPIAKHHSLARLTLGMKNLMGLIQDRPAMHRNLGQRLADLTSRIPPTLTVVDAMRMLMNNGPSGGNLADVHQMDTIVVSPDIVAADSYATTLFGLLPQDLDYIRAAVDMRLGRSDFDNLHIEEINVGV
jgi:uncharacterized protein (DUF362 family)